MKRNHRFKYLFRLPHLFLLLFISINPSLYAQLNSFETENLRLIHFGKIHSYMVPHVARCFENSLKFHRSLYKYTPTERVTVFLHDFNDYGNAGATAVPRNRIGVAMAPYNFVYETVPANERMNSTMNHELVHIVMNDKASDFDNFFRSIFFGKVAPTSDNPLSMIYSYFTTPRRYAPRWYHEGIAVFLETWMAGGFGRALGSFDEMIFRTMIKDSTHIYDLVSLESAGTRIDFQVGVNSYLYGTRFMSYLALKYEPETLIEWSDRTPDSKSYFANQFETIYAIPIDAAWSDWISWENEFQTENLNTIRKYPITNYHIISKEPLGSMSRSFYDSTEQRIYTALSFPGQIPQIAAININTGEVESISEVKGAALYYVTSLIYNEASKTIFYTTDNNQWRDLNSVNVKTNESKILIKDGRIGDLAFNKTDGSIWGVRHYNGLSTLVRIPFPYNEWNSVHTFSYGKDIYDIDVSPNGEFITASLVEISGKQTLIIMETNKLLENDASFETLYDFDPSIPSNFVFSKDGNHLFGSSYYTGVSNIYRYDFDSGKMNILSNCETGLFRPFQYTSDSLIASRYSQGGLSPVIVANKPIHNVKSINFLGQNIVETYPIVTKWLAGSPADINIDSLKIFSGEYSGLNSIDITSIYPIVEGYKDFPAYGLRLNLSDPVGFHNFNITASYSPNNLLTNDEKWHANANYEYMNWKFSLDYNYANFYDLFGPTKVSRKGYSIGVIYNKALLYDRPKTIDYTISIAHYGNLERLPDYQNVGVSFDKFYAGSIQFNYKYLRASLGAVDYEKGFKWGIVSSGNYVNNTFYPRILNNFDFGIALPINHSSIWLRSSVGYSLGEHTDPSANFYFGGFGNNWVDYLHEKRYREYYSFPGVEINDISGINYGKLLAEWNLPPIIFQHVGSSAFYITWARASIFSTGIITNLDDADYRRKVFNIGTQIDFKIIMLSHLKLTFSFGYALAFEELQQQSNEIMMSLKIL